MNKIHLNSITTCVKNNFMKPYIMRNGGLVTPQLDYILEKAIFEQLLGKLVGHRYMRAPYNVIPSIYNRGGMSQKCCEKE